MGRDCKACLAITDEPPETAFQDPLEGWPPYDIPFLMGEPERRLVHHIFDEATLQRLPSERTSTREDDVDPFSAAFELCGRADCSSLEDTELSHHTTLAVKSKQR